MTIASKLGYFGSEKIESLDNKCVEFSNRNRRLIGNFIGSTMLGIGVGVANALDPSQWLSYHSVNASYHELLLNYGEDFKPEAVARNTALLAYSTVLSQAVRLLTNPYVPAIKDCLYQTLDRIF